MKSVLEKAKQTICPDNILLQCRNELKSIEFSLNRTGFSEFSQFRETDKSLKHELGSI